eukprot:jgi/Mesvir1/20989/Mv08051-RA.2
MDGSPRASTLKGSKPGVRESSRSLKGAAPRQSQRSSKDRISGVRSSRRSLISKGKGGRGDDDDSGRQMPVQVLNAQGVDVTPKPLQLGKPQVGPREGGQAGAPGSIFGVGVPSMCEVTDVMDRFTMASSGMSMKTGVDSGLDVPTLADSMFDYTPSDAVADGHASMIMGAMPGGAAGKDAAGRRPGGAASNGWTIQSELELKDGFSCLPPPEAELEKSVYLQLCETETFFLLTVPGLVVGSDAPDAARVTEENERYSAQKARNAGSENFADIGIQALTVLLKDKEVQIKTNSKESTACQASAWDINDTMEALADGEAVDSSEGIGGSIERANREASAAQSGSMTSMTGKSMHSAVEGTMSGASKSMVGTSMATWDNSLMGGKAAAPGNAAEDAKAAANKDEKQRSVEDFANLPKAFVVMERAITQNIYHDKLLLYRNHRPREIIEDLRGQEPAAVAASEASSQSEGTTGEAPANPAAESTLPASNSQGAVPNATPAAAPAGAPSDGDHPAAPPDASTATSAAASVVISQPDPSAIHPDGSPCMPLLWEFRCKLTEGRNASCCAWNRVKRDLLAAGYGQYEFSKQRDGVIAFWSLKNPQYPEWAFLSPSGVTSLDWSTSNPNYLAVGFYDGAVSVYDVRLKSEKPILESGHTSGKHSDPVWKLKWVTRGDERGESLVSISTDGRITQWSIKKGLEFTDLMKLKRVVRSRKQVRRPPPAAAGANGAAPAVPPAVAANTKTEAFISRRSSGMCFDFSRSDASMYLAGTEDGTVHKCSVSYSEQYLESYFGHSGPIYQVAWSPFSYNIFLTASADWTVRLWKEEKVHGLADHGKTGRAGILFADTSGHATT